MHLDLGKKTISRDKHLNELIKIISKENIGCSISFPKSCPTLDILIQEIPIRLKFSKANMV